MKFGINLMVFSDIIDKDVVAHFELIKRLGFDGVEVPVFVPDEMDVDLIRSEAEHHQLDITTSGAMPQDSSFYGDGAAAHKSAEKYLRGGIRVTRELGGSVFCGPLYKPVGNTDESVPVTQQRQQAAKALRPLADEAAANGVMLAIEPLNRFETNFLNTIADGIAFVKDVGSQGAGILLDTFHMHIEEKNVASAITEAGKQGLLAHFHACENDRGTAGSGQVRWDAVSTALHAAEYRQWAVLETFCQTNEAIRRAVSCWRPFYENAEEFMRDGLMFVKQKFSGS